MMQDAVTNGFKCRALLEHSKQNSIRFSLFSESHPVELNQGWFQRGFISKPPLDKIFKKTTIQIHRLGFAGQ